MKDSPNKEAAYEVLDFLLQDENVQMYLDEQNAVPCKAGDFKLAPMLDGVADYIAQGKMTDYQDHHYPTEISVDAMLQTFLMERDIDRFLQRFDTGWIRYNRDLIKKVQDYQKAHPEAAFEGTNRDKGGK